MNLSRLFVTGAVALAASAAFAGTAGPSDSQIAAIVVAANQVDIDAGKLAEARASSPEVRAFAQRMVADHTGVNKQAVELVTRLKVKPEESDTSRSLKTAGDATAKKLQSLKGAEFDRAYVENEVTYHQTVLDALDKTLIPGARHAELKSLLVKVRPAFVAHLEHAKHLNASLKK